MRTRREFLEDSARAAAVVAGYGLSGCASLGSAVDRELVIGRLSAEQAAGLYDFAWRMKNPYIPRAKEDDRLIDGALFNTVQLPEAVRYVSVVGIIRDEQADFLNSTEWKKKNPNKDAHGGDVIVRGEVSELFRAIEGRD